MSELHDFIISYLSGFRTGFFIAQTLTIILLFLAGALFMLILKEKQEGLIIALLSYPLGLSLYVIAGILILVLEIEFTLRNLILALGVFFLIPSVIRFISFKRSGKKDSMFRTFKGRDIFFLLGALVLIAALSCSGLISIALSNDSMYYYSLYPRSLIFYGGFVFKQNVFLTDVGLGSAVLGTLPFFFDFNETFGIQTALNINFILIYAFSIIKLTVFKDGGSFLSSLKERDKRGTSLLILILSLIALLSSMPFIIMSKWAMSNMYFMEYMFICLFAALYFKKKRDEGEEKADSVKNLIILSLLTIMLSSLRMEGMIFVLFFVLSYSILEYPGNLLANFIILPCMVIYGLYFKRIFIDMFIDAPYTFLNKQKALLELLAMAALYIYLMLKKTLFRIFEKHLKALILSALLLVNGLLFIYDRSLYIMNLKAFFANLTNNSGWGMFPLFMAGLCMVTAVFMAVSHIRFRPGFMEYIVAGYLLITLAVGFARGDPLQENIGDSGNRVLLQAVPLIVYAVTERVIKVI